MSSESYSESEETTENLRLEIGEFLAAMDQPEARLEFCIGDHVFEAITENDELKVIGVIINNERCPLTDEHKAILDQSNLEF